MPPIPLFCPSCNASPLWISSTNYIFVTYIFANSPIPLQLQLPLLLKDGTKFTLRTNMQVQVQELEESNQLFFFASRLANLTPLQQQQRVTAMIQFALQHILQQTSREEIAADTELFYIYLQQRMGQALLQLGVRVIRVDVLGFECAEPHQHISYVGGNITNRYARRDNQIASWIFRFFFKGIVIL